MLQLACFWPERFSQPTLLNQGSWLLTSCVLVLVSTSPSYASQPTSKAEQQQSIQFNRDIRPILSNNCIACHGPDEKQRKAELRLDDEKSAKSSVIVAGDVKESELIARITSTDADTKMPPPESGKSLTKAEIKLLTEWVQNGADYEPHWAYVAPKKSILPKTKDTTWSSHWIDRFILAQLEMHGKRPALDADRITLLRRVYFDLIGLPPTPADVDSFPTVSPETSACSDVREVEEFASVIWRLIS